MGPISSITIVSAVLIASCIAFAPMSSKSDKFTLYLPILGPFGWFTRASQPCLPVDTSWIKKPTRTSPSLCSLVVIPPVLMPLALSISVTRIITVVLPVPGAPVMSEMGFCINDYMM